MVYWLGIIYGVLGFIGLVITIIILVVLNSKESKINVTPNQPQLLIYSRVIRSQTDSYWRGTIKTQKERPNGTTFIEFFPDDVEQGDQVPRPDMKWCVVKTEFIKRMASGDISGRRQQVIILPRSLFDLPQDMSETMVGKSLTKEGQLSYIKSTVGKYISEGDEAIAQALIELSRVGVTKQALLSIKEKANQMNKTSTTEDSSMGQNK